MPLAPDGNRTPSFHAFDSVFDDVDAMAMSAREWDQEYEQIGRGRFRGQLTQLIMARTQLGIVRWSPGILHKGTAPRNSWVFGLPVSAEGTLHVRRRPVQPGELLAATSRDDVGFTATGTTSLVVVVLPDRVIERWMQARRGVRAINPNLPPRRWMVSRDELSLRARALSNLITQLRPNPEITSEGLTHVKSQISDAILDMIPSAEVIKSLHNRARVARAALQLLHDRRDNPPSVTEMCEIIGTRERTLFLSCIEAFGRPPAQLLLELRLNAVRRELDYPREGMSVTSAASNFGFVHFGRFAAMYSQRFGELPSTTLTNSLRG